MPSPAIRRNLLTACISVLVLTCLTVGAATAGDGHSHKDMTRGEKTAGLVATNALSPASAPGVHSSAVYLELENASGAAVDLVGVESPAFATGHIHKTALADGLMTMEQVAQLSIPASSGVLFAPGGLHIMLTGAKKVFKPGDMFPVTLSFASGARLDVQITVVRPSGMPGGLHAHGSMEMN